MSIHYNAFISYRHHPEDIRVATQIHRALEHFRVPKSLRGKAKLPMRLFRDKDELPITSNLTDDISAALKNADYLIVICSVHTRESLWVQREIETFLKTHSRDKVLTVLANGEPYEVIPEVLLYQDVTDPETGETVRLPVEPLSCDWRIGHRKAMKEELPRLAAALLHCGYDELRQRQKQYRMRQLITLTSAALVASVALSAYFLYTAITIRNANIQIQENLDQALRNQSSFLATAAEERLEKGDRLTALALLLEALPGEENPRPYVADAEYVLTKALGLYDAGSSITAQAALIPSDSATVTDFVLSEDRQTLFLEDSRDIITGWDAQTLQQLCAIEPGAVIDEIIGTTHRSGIVFSMSGKRMLCCCSREGQRLWQLDGIQDAVLSDNGEKLYVIRIPGEDQRELLTVDTETGDLLREPLPLPRSPSGELAYAFVPEVLENQSGLLPMIFWDSSKILCLLNPETGEVTELLELSWSLRTACETEDGRFLFMVGDGTGLMNGIYGGNMYTSGPSGSDILCFDSAGELLWTSKITTCLYNGQHTLRPVPDSDRIFCQTGDTLQMISAVDGTILQSCSPTCAVIEIAEVAQDHVWGILEDGCIFQYHFDANQCDALDYNMGSNLKKSKFGSTIFTLAWNSSQVTAYSFTDIPSQWEIPLTGIDYTDQFRTMEEKLAFVTFDEICLFDMQQRKFRWRIPQNYLDLWDFSEDGSILWAADGYSAVYAISAETGEMQEYTIPWQWEGLFLNIKEAPKQIKNDFWFLASAAQKLRLFRVSPLTGETVCWDVLSTGAEIPPELADSAESMVGLETALEIWPELNDGEEHPAAEEIHRMMDALPGFLQKAEKARLVSANENRAWILDGEGTLTELNLETGEQSCLLENLTAMPPIAVRESDGALAVSVDDAILLFVPGEEQPRSVQLNYERGGSLCFRGEELLVVCDSGCMLRFDDSLRQLSRTELTVNGSFSTSLFSAYRDIEDITWQFAEDGRLYLNLFQLMNVIDCSQWSSTCYLADCIAYDPAENQFIGGGGNVIRGYSRYDTADLIQIAREQLGSFRLSQRQKEDYGID